MSLLASVPKTTNFASQVEASVLTVTSAGHVIVGNSLSSTVTCHPFLTTHQFCEFGLCKFIKYLLFCFFFQNKTLKMRPFIVLIISLFFPIILFSQNLEVEGKAKITVMNNDETTDSLVVLRPGGELARRHVEYNCILDS